MTTRVFALFRASDTMALWGITHTLRPGQSPGDLWRARKESIERWREPRPAQTVGVPEPLKLDWVWLGSPGWWGDMPDKLRAQIEAFTEKHSTLIPESPNEWTNLEEFEVELILSV